MKLLLVLLLGVAGSGVFASNLAAPIVTLIGGGKAYLARSVHKMVASGYRLYSGNLAYQNTRADILIYRDHLRDGARIYARSKDVTMDAVAHAEGIYAQERVYLQAAVVLPEQKQNELWQHMLSDYELHRQGDDLRASFSDGWGVFDRRFAPSSDYRVYRGERPGVETDITIVETITVNGYNPYVVYRHTAWHDTTTDEIISEELSIGTYSYLAINPTAIDAEVVASYGERAQPVSTGTQYGLLGGKLTTFAENQKSTGTVLAKIIDSEVYHRFEGNPGFTGSELAVRLVEQLRERGLNDAAKIAEELAAELPASLVASD